jgi:hypothetical protein
MSIISSDSGARQRRALQPRVRVLEVLADRSEVDRAGDLVGDGLEG